MPASQLLELVKSQGYAALEARVLEQLAASELRLANLAPAVKHLETSGQGEKVAALAQVVLESANVPAEPEAATGLARAALLAAPNDAKLRAKTADVYRAAYGDRPGFDVALEASGLLGGRPPRSALKVLDFLLTMKPGDTLIGRMEEHVGEIVDIDHNNALFTLKVGGRMSSLPAAEVAREFDPVPRDDFRVLRQLRPGELSDMVQQRPVELVIALLRSHGGSLTSDALKNELTPKLLQTSEWSGWWTKARGALKRSPHVQMEGRSPVVLTYSEAGQTLEDETWTVFAGQNDPEKWLATLEGYLREKTARKEMRDEAFLKRCHDHIVNYVRNVRSRRPSEALACALVLDKLVEEGLPATDESLGMSLAMLKDADDPAKLIAALPDDALWERALDRLRQSRPEDWHIHSEKLMPLAPAGLLDDIVGAAIAAGHAEMVQTHIDAAARDPLTLPEIAYWLWKKPKNTTGLKLPPAAELFSRIMDTLSALGRTLNVSADVSKHFRARAKAALALRDFGRVREVIKAMSEPAAVGLRRQIERMEGLGDNAPSYMLDILRDAHPQLWVKKQQRIQRWEEADTLWATQAGLTKKTAERDTLVNVTMRENAKRIGEAASYGDLSENSEYKFALEERDLLRARLAQMNNELSIARPLEPQDVQTDYVDIGTRVTIRNVADGGERAMTFFGPFETDIEGGYYSYKAPVSQKLMGRRVGERTALNIDGHEAEFEVVSIENGFSDAAVLQ